MCEEDAEYLKCKKQSRLCRCCASETENCARVHGTYSMLTWPRCGGFIAPVVRRMHRTRGSPAVFNLAFSSATASSPYVVRVQTGKRLIQSAQSARAKC